MVAGVSPSSIAFLAEKSRKIDAGAGFISHTTRKVVHFFRLPLILAQKTHISLIVID